jgi:hypothetical protein
MTGKSGTAPAGATPLKEKSEKKVRKYLGYKPPSSFMPGGIFVISHIVTPVLLDWP